MNNQRPKDISVMAYEAEGGIGVVIKFKLTGKLFDKELAVSEPNSFEWSRYVQDRESERKTVQRHIERSLSTMWINFSKENNTTDKSMAAAVNWTGLANMTGTSIEDLKNTLLLPIEDSLARATKTMLDAAHVSLNRETKVEPRPVSLDFIDALKDFGARPTWTAAMEKEHKLPVLKHDWKWWGLNIINNMFIHPILPIADALDAFGWTWGADVIYRLHDRTSPFPQHDC